MTAFLIITVATAVAGVFAVRHELKAGQARAERIASWKGDREAAR